MTVVSHRFVESTGGLERPLLEALLEAGLPAALVHPGRVRNLAKALGILAKTDRIDAHVLVLFGQKAGPRITERGEGLVEGRRPACSDSPRRRWRVACGTRRESASPHQPY